MMDDDEEIDVIYHGTTLQAANQIRALKRFETKTSYFAGTRDLAFYFARRSCQRRGSVLAKPAVLSIALYKSDLKDWKQARLIHSSGFDEGDAVELRGKTQMLFTGEAVRLLNVYSFKDEWRVETEQESAP